MSRSKDALRFMRSKSLLAAIFILIITPEGTFIYDCNEVLLKMFLSCSQFNLFLHADVVVNEVVPSSSLLIPFFSDGLHTLMGCNHFHVDCFAYSICSNWSRKMDILY